MLPLTNKYIKNKPFAKQLGFILLPHMEALYGGQAGGGKSDALLAIGLQYKHVPGHSSIIFRKTLTDLKQSSALIDRSHKWLSGTDAVWKGDEHCWYFPTVEPNGKVGHPSRLQFGYIGESNAHTRYQSAEYQDIIWDELTQHAEYDYRYMFSRLRKPVCPTHQVDDKGKPIYVDGCPMCQLYKSIPLRVRSATNPGNSGHEWVRERFQIEPQDGRNPYEIAEDDTTVVWVGKNPELPFIQASYRDNPYIDQESYGASLDKLPPVERARLKHGNWAVNPDSRFKRSWARYYSHRGDNFILKHRNLPEQVYHWKSDFKRIFGVVDPASSQKEGMTQVIRGEEPSSTVIAICALTWDYNLLFLDVDKFQDEIPEVVNRIYRMHKLWLPEYMRMESNGPGRGVYQFVSLRRVPTKPVARSVDKVVASTNAQIQMKSGRVWFPASSPWLKEWCDEIFNWTGDPNQKDDQVDVLSDAVNDVDWENAPKATFADSGFDVDPAPLTLDELPGVIPFHQIGYYEDPFEKGSNFLI